MKCSCYFLSCKSCTWYGYYDQGGGSLLYGRSFSLGHMVSKDWVCEFTQDCTNLGMTAGAQASFCAFVVFDAPCSPAGMRGQQGGMNLDTPYIGLSLSASPKENSSYNLSACQSIGPPAGFSAQSCDTKITYCERAHK